MDLQVAPEHPLRPRTDDEGVAGPRTRAKTAHLDPEDALLGGPTPDLGGGIVGPDGDLGGQPEGVGRRDRQGAGPVDRGVADPVEERDPEPDRVPRVGDAGGGDDHPGGRTRHDVDGGRIGDETADAVAVAVDAEPEGLAGLGIGVGARGEEAGAVDETHGLAAHQGAAPDAGHQHAPIGGLHGQRDAFGLGGDEGVAGGLGHFGLRSAPAPEGRALEDQHAVDGDAEGPHLVVEGPGAGSARPDLARTVYQAQAPSPVGLAPDRRHVGAHRLGQARPGARAGLRSGLRNLDRRWRRFGRRLGRPAA